MSKARIYGAKRSCVPNREADRYRRKGKRDHIRGLTKMVEEKDLDRARDKQERKLREEKEAALG